MLRLHPSELTLTPEDVDETFRRIALRQSSPAQQQQWMMLPAGQPGQSGRPNRPILRRGPQRSVRRAITINNIAIVQPPQAANTSVDEDDEFGQQAAQMPVQANSRPTWPHPTHDRNNAIVGFPAALPSPPIQLPLRLRSHLQGPDGQTISNEQAQGSTLLSPQNHLPSPTRSASTRSVENGSEARAQLPSVDPSANTAGLRGGGLTSVARPQDVTQDTIHALSPLNHIQRLGSRSGKSPVSLARTSDVSRDDMHATSPLDQTQRLTLAAQQLSPGDATKPQNSPSTGHPTAYSTQCSAETRHSIRCHYREDPPGGEARRGSGRPPRSQSSGGAASPSVMGPSSSIVEGASNGSFVPSTIAEVPSRHCRGSSNPHSEDVDTSSAKHLSNNLEDVGQSDQTSLRRRERGSGATVASVAYSWYGSLGSDGQFQGSENSQNDECCRQVDGTRTNSHRLSPLPALPYTRTQKDSPAPSPPSAHCRQLSGDHAAATTAVRHGLQLPLDAYVEQWQHQQQTPHPLLNLTTRANATTSFVGGLPVTRPNREQDVPSDNSTRLGPGPNYGASHQQQSSPEYRTYDSRNVSHASNYPRQEQRLSENAPVSGTGHGRVQMQRAVYERLQNAAYMMQSGGAGGIDMAASSHHHSGPPRNPPHDVLNRSRSHIGHDGERFDSSGSSANTHQTRQPSQVQNPCAVDAGSSRPRPRQFSRQHSTESARQASPRVSEGVSSSHGAQPRREGPLSSLGLFEPGVDATSRQAQSPLLRGPPTAPTRTYRRVRGEQRDQENGGEEELMRREEANVAARYGDEEQRRMTMNETPPGIGRVERRMME